METSTTAIARTEHKKPLTVPQVLANDAVGLIQKVVHRLKPNWKSLPAYVGDAAVIGAWWAFPWPILNRPPSSGAELAFVTIGVCSIITTTIIWPLFLRSFVKEKSDDYIHSVTRRIEESHEYHLDK